MVNRKLIEDCVHCGFCLPACPTYRSWGNEMDSPRGRIYLMRALGAGQVPLSSTVVRHFDQCLGCMACVSACPSGVKYDELIEETRFDVERQHRRPLGERLLRGLLFALLPYPRRLTLLVWLAWVYQKLGLRWLLQRLGLLRLLPARLRNLEALMPEVTAQVLFTRVARQTQAQGEQRARVALLSGCVQGAFFPEVNAATLRVLAAEGCATVVAKNACCGALALHAGRQAQALSLARECIQELERTGADTIVVNAAGCGSAMKEWGRLFRDDRAWAARAEAAAAKVRDVNEFLCELGPRAPRHALPVRAAMHHACHLHHAQRIREQPRVLLGTIPGLELMELEGADECCGSAGVYNLLLPESAAAIGRRKADNVRALGPELLISANPGCTLQIAKALAEQGHQVRAAHPVQVLDASIRGATL
jgi:glycolate oxidase iron-sulfur subunit